MCFFSVGDWVDACLPMDHPVFVDSDPDLVTELLKTQGDPSTTKIEKLEPYVEPKGECSVEGEKVDELNSENDEG